MNNALEIIQKSLPTVMWSLVFISTLMLLSLYDAETFLISFVLIMMSVLGALISLPSGALKIPRAPVLFLVAAFWTLAFISAVLSESSFTSYIFFCFLGMFPLSFFYTVLVGNKEVFFRSIYKIGLTVYAVLATITIAQYFFLPEILPNGLTQYPFGNPNSLAGYLSLGFFPAYAGFITVQKPKARALLLVMTLLIFMAILTTGSRGGVLALLGGFVIMLVALRAQIAQHTLQHIIFAALAVASFVALSVLAPAAHFQTPIDVTVNTISGDTPVLWDRPHIWASTWGIIKDNFWTGIGVGTFFQVYPAYRAGDASTAGHMAHNDILQFWAEMGILAPLLFIALMIFIVHKTVKAFASAPKDSLDRVKIIAPFCALGAMVAHTQISFHFYVLPMLLVAGTLLAYWFAQVEKHVPSKSINITCGVPLENAIVKLCLSALLIACLAMLTLFQVSEIMVDRGKARIKSGDMQGFTDDINRAGEVSFKRNARALALASTVPSRIVQSNATDMTPGHILKLLLQAEGLLNRSLANNPHLASSYHEKALITEMALKYVPQQYKAHHKGNPPNVRALMEEAFARNPLHSGTRIKLALLMEENGESDAAYTLLKEGLAWKYLGTKGFKFYELLATKALERGDIQTQTQALNRIKEVYAQSKVIQDNENRIIEKIGPLWPLIKNR